MVDKEKIYACDLCGIGGTGSLDQHTCDPEDIQFFDSVHSINEGHFLELATITALLRDTWASHVLEHTLTEAIPGFSEPAQKVFDHISELYQLVGVALYEDEDRDKWLEENPLSAPYTFQADITEDKANGKNQS